MSIQYQFGLLPIYKDVSITDVLLVAEFQGQNLVARNTDAENSTDVAMYLNEGSNNYITFKVEYNSGSHYLYTIIADKKYYLDMTSSSAVLKESDKLPAMTYNYVDNTNVSSKSGAGVFGGSLINIMIDGKTLAIKVKIEGLVEPAIVNKFRILNIQNYKRVDAVCSVDVNASYKAYAGMEGYDSKYTTDLQTCEKEGFFPVCATESNCQANCYGNCESGSVCSVQESQKLGCISTNQGNKKKAGLIAGIIIAVLAIIVIIVVVAVVVKKKKKDKDTNNKSASEMTEIK
jgi:hypothetical protein